MPATTRTDKVMTYMSENPGWHRPRDVAEALGYDTSHPVALSLRDLAEQGRLLRKRTTRSASVYSHPAI